MTLKPQADFSASPSAPRTVSLLAGTLAIAWKELRAEARSREKVIAMLVFALLAITLFSLALELDRIGRAASASGVMWVTLIFAGTMGLGRSLGREKDEGTLDGLLLAPVDRSALFFGKLIGNFVFMLVVALVLAAALTVLFNISFFVPLIFVALVLGILGYAGVGTLIASMSAYSRGREVLLPILLLPVALSILIPAVRATRGLLDGLIWEDVAVWFNLLAGTNVVYLTLGYMLFDYVVEE